MTAHATTKPTKTENFRRLAEALDEARAALRSIDDHLIAHTVLEAGWHPHRGEGKALATVLTQEHRALTPFPPYIPKVTVDDVVELANRFGFTADFEKEATNDG